jgi:hypothetical protein
MQLAIYPSGRREQHDSNWCVAADEPRRRGVVKKTKKTRKVTKAKKAGKAKASRKRSAVKDLPAKKAATVRGGLPAVQKVREAAARQESLPTEQLSVNYAKIQF